eukprot:15431944-Alexandrium_andersonii.AAC.1
MSGGSSSSSNLIEGGGWADKKSEPYSSPIQALFFSVVLWLSGGSTPGQSGAVWGVELLGADGLARQMISE